jgi:hypothetical protein
MLGLELLHGAGHLAVGRSHRDAGRQPTENREAAGRVCGSLRLPRPYQTAVAPGKVNRGGMTPTIVAGVPFSEIDEPITLGFVPSRCCRTRC